MSDLQSDIRSLVRSIVGDDSDRDDTRLWSRLVEAGIDQVGADRDSTDSGDLWDLAACLEEIAAAGRSTPLLSRALARWIVGATERPVGIGTGRLDGGSGCVETSYVGKDDLVVVVGSDAAPVVVDTSADGVELLPGTNVGGEPVMRLLLTGVAPAGVDDVSGTGATARLHVLRSAQLLGATRGLFSRTKEFVRQREQFGGPLIKIPAVSAKLGVMRTWLLQSEVALRRAEHVMGYGTDEQLATAALGARIIAAEAATNAAEIAHQLHGAIGVTEEFGLHHLSKRVWAWRDADCREQDLAIELGVRAFAADEPTYWESVTA